MNRLVAFVDLERQNVTNYSHFPNFPNTRLNHGFSFTKSCGYTSTVNALLTWEKLFDQLNAGQSDWGMVVSNKCQHRTPGDTLVSWMKMVGKVFNWLVQLGRIR